MDESPETGTRVARAPCDEGVELMGRGRQKAKQTKVARELKYSTGSLDPDRLKAELAGSSPSPFTSSVKDDDEDPYVDPYADDDEDEDAR